MLVKAGSFSSASVICVIFTAVLTSKSRVIRLKLEVIRPYRMGRTSDKKELNGGSSWVSLDWLTSSEEIGNCEPISVEGATSGFIVGGWLVDSMVRESGSSGEAGLDGIFEGGEIGNRKVTPELVGRSKPGGVRGQKSFRSKIRTCCRLMRPIEKKLVTAVVGSRSRWEKKLALEFLVKIICATPTVSLFLSFYKFLYSLIIIMEHLAKG